MRNTSFTMNKNGSEIPDTLPCKLLLLLLHSAILCSGSFLYKSYYTVTYLAVSLRSAISTQAPNCVSKNNFFKSKTPCE